LWLPCDGAVNAQFPVNRAESEFLTLIPHIEGYCGVTRGNLDDFRRAVLPFGPMDLTVLNGTNREKEILRNLFLGMVGRACGLDAAMLGRTFQCGRSCVATRENELRSNLGPIREVVARFASLGDVDLISQWGVVGEYRIDDVFVMMGQMKETRPSPIMGFVPSDVWMDVSDLSAYLSRRHASRGAFDAVLRTMKRLSLAAVVREHDGIRVIRVGVGDNESGLLFTNGRGRPRMREPARGGRIYTVAEELEKNVFYYETASPLSSSVPD
jgi:hypothetical protein